VKISLGERIFKTVNTILLLLLCAFMLYPIMFVVGRSFMGDAERALAPLRLFPKKPDFSGYNFIFFSGSNILHGYFITIMRTLIGTSLNVALTAMMAYPLSKKYLPKRKFFTGVVVFTMWFYGGMIPHFLLIKSLGLMNNFWVYILPSAINAFNLIILRNFFMQIPESLEECAKLDGANDLYIFLKIYLPLSKASLATITLFYAVTHWNSWFDSLLYVNSKDLWTLQYMLQQLIQSASINDISNASTITERLPAAETVRMATIVVATVPILCIYPFLQKYFVKGVLVGSVKG